MIKRNIREVAKTVFSLVLGILPVIFWLCLIYSFDERLGASITILAMIIHEAGHLLCIFITTNKFQIPRGTYNGLRISGRNCASYPEHILHYASGAGANLLAASAALLLAETQNEYVKLFITINIATAVSNLFPIDGYDGYRIVEMLIEYFGLGFMAYMTLEIISFVFTALFCIFSLFLVYTFGNGYWFMAIFLFATINKLQKWQNHQNARF